MDSSVSSGVEDAFLSPTAIEHHPPKMRGLKADMTELTGTLSSGISRFTSLIKVVTGEDLLPKRKGNADSPRTREEIEGNVLSPNAGLGNATAPLGQQAPPTNLGQNPNSGQSQEGVDRLDSTNELNRSEGFIDSARQGAQKDFEAFTGSIASGFSKLASRFPNVLSLVNRDEDDEEEIDPEAVGVTEEVVAFATSIASHPETWLDFPLSSDETAQDLALTELQDDHVYILEQEAPQVAAIRTELCPAFMSEERFWRVYFVLLASRLGTAQAAQLLTPDILAERKLLMEKLRKERGPLAEDAFEEGAQSTGTEEALLQPAESKVAVKESGEDPPNRASESNSEQQEAAATKSDKGSTASEALLQQSGETNPAPESAPRAGTGPPADEDEEGVDDWLDDEDDHAQGGGGEQGQSDPHETEESSFSELEEEEGASKDVVPVLKPVGSRVPDGKRGGEEAARGMGWVQLHRTASQGLKTVSSSSDFEHEETSGEGTPDSPAATNASHQGGSGTNSESGNEWLTVDAEDGRSTVS